MHRTMLESLARQRAGVRPDRIGRKSIALHALVSPETIDRWAREGAPIVQYAHNVAAYSDLLIAWTADGVARRTRPDNAVRARRSAPTPSSAPPSRS